MNKRKTVQKRNKQESENPKVKTNLSSSTNQHTKSSITGDWLFRGGRGVLIRILVSLAALFTIAYKYPLINNLFEIKSEMASLQTSRTVLKAIMSHEQAEGMGARVRRSIGTMQLRNFDPFLMLDEFNVQKPAGFPDHPHRGFETVTYMISGRISHEDFAGHAGTIGPGDLQWMTAGRGIVHAEMPSSDEPSIGLQLWINLPKSEKLCAPRYQELLDKDIPRVKPVDGVEVKVIAGRSHGVESPVYTKSPAYYLDYKMSSNTSAFQELPSGWNSFAYLLSGKAKFGGTICDAHSTVVLSNEPNQTGVQIEAVDECRFVLISGKPLNEPIQQHGPFVMTTREEIMEAFDDYRNGRNGFEKATSWASKIGQGV